MCVRVSRSVWIGQDPGSQSKVRKPQWCVCTADGGREGRGQGDLTASTKRTKCQITARTNVKSRTMSGEIGDTENECRGASPPQSSREKALSALCAALLHAWPPVSRPLRTPCTMVDRGDPDKSNTGAGL